MHFLSADDDEAVDAHEQQRWSKHQIERCRLHLEDLRELGRPPPRQISNCDIDRYPVFRRQPEPAMSLIGSPAQMMAGLVKSVLSDEHVAAIVAGKARSRLAKAAATAQMPVGGHLSAEVR
jgi:hypothetical protein